MQNEDYEKVNFPDLSFHKICQKKYGINRGVYNTIDSWFYDKGMKNILTRRKTTLDFLRFISSSLGTTKIKFGNGGLVAKLTEYWETGRISKIINESLEE